MTANWTIDGVKEALAAKKISARELAADFYKRIEARNPELNAFLALSQERARRQTDRIDALVAEGKPLPPLAGVPVAVKDVISTRGIKTTCGSKILLNFVPTDDASALRRVEGAHRPLSDQCERRRGGPSDHRWARPARFDLDDGAGPRLPRGDGETRQRAAIGDSQRIFRPRHGSRSAQEDRSRHRSLQETGMQTGADSHAADGLRQRVLLRHRDGGSELQPGAIRRSALWIARG